MLNIRHLLRLYAQNQTVSEIMIQTGIKRNVLKQIINDYIESGLDFSELNSLSDSDLDDLFKRPDERKLSERLQTLYSLFPAMDAELKKKGVTKSVLWDEYRQKYTDCVSRRTFYAHFAKWKARKNPVMRQEHKDGDKLFIDFAGEKLCMTDLATAKEIPVEVFVAVLGASQLTYVEAVMTQKKEDFISACENALHFIQGVPGAIVSDNLKAAVTKTDKYEPTINETFADFAEHYNTTILPARAYRPTDKAVVENTIKIIYSRIYAKLRNAVFHTLESLNAAIIPFLEEHNSHALTGRSESRMSLFESSERAALLPLPAMRYEFKKQLYATVTKNGYVALSIDKHYYSVPYVYIGKKVKLMFTNYRVEIYLNYERIAVHQRVQSPFKYTTDKEHLHPAHRLVAELDSERLLTIADEIHHDVKLYLSKILESKRHPEHLYKVCSGVLSLSKKYGDERLTKACQRSLIFGIYSYRAIKKILESGLDIYDEDDIGKADMPQHENIRGSDYYI